MLLTQFIICTKYPVILPLRRSPKVYLELASFLHRQTTFRKVGFTSGNSRDIFGNCLFFRVFGPNCDYCKHYSQ